MTNPYWDDAHLDNLPKPPYAMLGIFVLLAIVIGVTLYFK